MIVCSRGRVRGVNVGRAAKRIRYTTSSSSTIRTRRGSSRRGTRRRTRRSKTAHRRANASTHPCTWPSTASFGATYAPCPMTCAPNSPACARCSSPPASAPPTSAASACTSGRWLLSVLTAIGALRDARPVHGAAKSAARSIEADGRLESGLHADGCAVRCRCTHLHLSDQEVTPSP